MTSCTSWLTDAGEAIRVDIPDMQGEETVAPATSNLDIGGPVLENACSVALDLARQLWYVKTEATIPVISNLPMPVEDVEGVEGVEGVEDADSAGASLSPIYQCPADVEAGPFLRLPFDQWSAERGHEAWLLEDPRAKGAVADAVAQWFQGETVDSPGVRPEQVDVYEIEDLSSISPNGLRVRFVVNIAAEIYEYRDRMEDLKEQFNNLNSNA